MEKTSAQSTQKIDRIYKIGPSIKTITNNCNCFWKDVFDSYFYFSSKVHPTTLHEFENTSFVLNENIKIAKNSIGTILLYKIISLISHN